MRSKNKVSHKSFKNKSVEGKFHIIRDSHKKSNKSIKKNKKKIKVKNKKKVKKVKK